MMISPLPQMIWRRVRFMGNLIGDLDLGGSAVDEKLDAGNEAGII